MNPLSILPILTTIRKEIAIAAGPHSLTLRQGQDFEFHVRLMANTQASYSALPEPLVYKTNRPGSQSGDRLEVWTEMLQALGLLSESISKRYSDSLAECANKIGSILFQLGHRPHAKEAFQLARRLGTARFSQDPLLYRSCARAFGPEVTETIAAYYRALLPNALRRWVRG